MCTIAQCKHHSYHRDHADEIEVLYVVVSRRDSCAGVSSSGHGTVLHRHYKRVCYETTRPAFQTSIPCYLVPFLRTEGNLPHPSALVLVDYRHQSLLVLSARLALDSPPERGPITRLELVLDSAEARPVPVGSDEPVDPTNSASACDLIRLVCVGCGVEVEETGSLTVSRPLCPSRPLPPRGARRRA